MAYLFPFGLVPAGSKIILYGMGDVGKDLYLQLRELKDRYELLAWTATTIDDYELKNPFDYVRNIPSYSYDYVIIAVMARDKALQIRETLNRLGVPKEKQIWSPQHYTMGGYQLPTNRPMLLQNLDDYMDILDERRKSKSPFSGGGAPFYQSYLGLGFSGQRSTGDRILLYRLADYLKKTDEVLDVGCNCGFFDLQVAPMVKHITGYEVDEHLAKIADLTGKLVKCKNAEFFCADYWTVLQEKKRYNAVFACAIHYWVLASGIQPSDFVGRLYDVLDDGGYLFFESHDLGSFGDRKLFAELCAMFLSRGMECVYRKNYKTDYEREIAVFRKIAIKGDRECIEKKDN